MWIGVEETINMNLLNYIKLQRDEGVTLHVTSGQDRTAVHRSTQRQNTQLQPVVSLLFVAPSISLCWFVLYVHGKLAEAVNSKNIQCFRPYMHEICSVLNTTQHCDHNTLITIR